MPQEPQPHDGEEPHHIFAYDHLYDSNSTSEEIYEDLGRPLVEGLFDGLNATIFAYGQTGSGKTHSMMGNADDPGVTPRVAEYIFEKADEVQRGAESDDASGSTMVEIYASYMQIYKENLQDLLAADPTKALNVRRDPKQGAYVEGLSERLLGNVGELAGLIEQGNKKRAVASTLMNAHSSRSHALVIIRIEQETSYYAQSRFKKKVLSKINLVDLAGSERASKSGASGETLQEMIAINQSLSALGNVINALTDPRANSKAHIPYRSSKLTTLLEPSLGGNSNTVMLAAISPTASNYGETLQTLQFASRAKRIVTRATINSFKVDLPEELPPSPVLEEIQETLLETRDAIVEPVAREAARCEQAVEACLGSIGAAGGRCQQGCASAVIPQLTACGSLVNACGGGLRGCCDGIFLGCDAVVMFFFRVVETIWLTPGRIRDALVEAAVRARDGCIDESRARHRNCLVRLRLFPLFFRAQIKRFVLERMVSGRSSGGRPFCRPLRAALPTRPSPLTRSLTSPAHRPPTHRSPTPLARSHSPLHRSYAPPPLSCSSSSRSLRAGTFT